MNLDFNNNEDANKLDWSNIKKKLEKIRSSKPDTLLTGLKVMFVEGVRGLCSAEACVLEIC